jgi:hypothetical protein
MDLGVSVSSGDATEWIAFKPQVNAWLMDSEEHEMKGCLLDPSTLKTGWIKIAKGEGADCHWDESVGAYRTNPRPSDDHRRGFQIMLYIKDHGWKQWQSNGVGPFQGLQGIFSKLGTDIEKNEGKVVQLKYTGSEVNDQGKGVTRVPQFEILGWTDNPVNEEEQSKDMASLSSADDEDLF